MVATERQQAIGHKRKIDRISGAVLNLGIICSGGRWSLGEGKSLVIVESPAKARTIEKILGKHYQVKASLGHVRDLPRSQFGVDVEKGFAPKYITIRGKGELLKELREAAKKAGKIYLATDPDREGEAISWHLAEVLGIPDREACRVVFHEITKEAVKRAVKAPRPIEANLVNAQQARRILDRLVGYQLSPLLWQKVRKGLSAGRVQSVAVRLLVDREDEIESFKPEEYWSLTAKLRSSQDKAAFPARYWGGGEERCELKNEGQVQEILAGLEGVAYTVRGVSRKERRKVSPPPFTTSTLQQAAARRLGFTVKKTMAVAQQLYEGLDVKGEGRVGLITYMRTDSVRLADEAVASGLSLIRERYGEDYAHPVARKDEGKRVQGAHEAIRPTSAVRDPARLKEDLSRDQHRLYRLIWERYVASLCAPAVLDQVTVEIAAGEAASQRFRATGSSIRFSGFLAVYGGDQDEAQGLEKGSGEEGEEEGRLPDLTPGEVLHLVKLQPEQHFTQPAPRYNEAALVKTLEEKGIGRPSTYAPTIETIVQRGYVQRKEKRLWPTELGRIVDGILREHFPRVVDVTFTAELEEDLDRVEEGNSDWQRVVGDFYTPFSEDLEQAKEAIGQVEVPEEVSDIPCEKCGRMLVVKHGRYGKFLACPGFPECRNTRPYAQPTGARCPTCGADVMERKSKRGRTFFGCSRYPECNFVTWDRPTKVSCPNCGAFLAEKRSRGKVNRNCAAGCGYTEKDVDEGEKEKQE